MTFVERTDPAARGFRMLVPDVRGREFATRTIVVPNVPVSPAARLNLRVWALHSSGERFTLSFASGGRTIAQNSFTTGPDGFFTVGDLMHEFPQLAGRKLTADVIITLDGDDRLWAFVTATDNATNLPRLLLPRAGGS